MNQIPNRKFRTLRGVYDVVPWDGKDTSGFMPFGDRVLVLPDQPAEKSTGGIIMGSEDEREKVALAAESGVIIAMGEDAFIWNSNRTRKLEGKRPEVGTRVFFKRYVGEMYPARDGRFYMILSDHSIGGMETPDA
jgi:co-chaperonin GroES (HSP10)